ncbi:MAG TPA: hypothetical protein QF644_00350 [Candidatus Poseidoniaceae archaeon]|nr:hypothetical protein [Candidatus Poseidoniaceae archaeon]
MKLDLLLFRISLLCIISGPICFIIGMNMDLFYSSDIAWGPALAWWGVGIISFIVGVILLIIASIWKSSGKGLKNYVSVNNSTSMFISSDDE